MLQTVDMNLTGRPVPSQHYAMMRHRCPYSCTRHAEPVASQWLLKTLGKASQRHRHRASATLSPSEALNKCLECFASKSFDSKLFADNLQHGQLFRDRQDPGPSQLHIEAMVASSLLSAPTEQAMDSYAVRNLLLSSPASCQELSSLSLGSRRWIRRCSVTSPQGEEAVLTFTMQLTPHTSSSSPTPGGRGSGHNDSSGSSSGSGTSSSKSSGSSGREGGYADGNRDSSGTQGIRSAGDASQTPQADGAPGSVSHPLKGGNKPGSGDKAGAPPSSSGGIRMESMAGSGEGAREGEGVWQLSGVVGEPLHSQLPDSPSPEWPPEVVVAAQMEALRQRDYARVFALLSPAAQQLVGPLSTFTTGIARNRAYRALVQHGEWESVRRCQASRNSYLEVTAVLPPPPLAPRAWPPQQGPSLYCWVVTRVTEDDSPIKDCWVTDWVKVVNDPALLSALGIRSEDGRGKA
ncbi:hypothetical protein V8C86DRAFT_380096 [Haematococcus lacustris]